MQSRSRTKRFSKGLASILSSGLLLAGLLLAPQSASAQSLDDCLNAAAGGSFNCTANDVQLGLLIVSDPQTQCVLDPDDGLFKATVQLQAQLRATANARFDIGMYIAIDGGDARTGTCFRNYLPGLPYDELEDINTYNEGFFGLGNGPGPFFDAEDVTPSDQCGDLEQQVDTFYDVLELGATTGLPFGSFEHVTVELVCEDQDDDGFVDVATCTSWDNTQNNLCLSAFDAVPNTPSKCNCERVNTTLQMPGFLKLVKNTTGGNGTFIFNHSISGLDSSLTTSGGTDMDTSAALTPGTGFAIDEPVPTGWDLTGISCQLEGGGSTGTPDSTPVPSGGTGGITNITVEAGKTTTCTFTNTRQSALLQLRKTWTDGILSDRITAGTSGFSNDASLDSTSDGTASDTDTGASVSVFVGESGTLPAEAFQAGDPLNYTTVAFACDGNDIDPSNGLVIDSSDAGNIITCLTTNTRIPIDPICRTPGFWGTHGGVEKVGSLNITQMVIDAATGGSLSICGQTIDSTAVGDEMSALEAVCVSPKGDQRLQLARQLTAAALNCVMSGAGADCGGLPEVAATFGACNLACANDTDLGTCIEDLDDFNNGLTTDPSCHDQPLVNDALGLDFDPSGPAGSSQACKAATKNSTIILP